MLKSNNDDFIIQIAKDYVRYKNATYRSLADKYHIGKTTVGNYLINKLKNIDGDLYDKVLLKRDYNINLIRIKFTKKYRKKKCKCKRIKCFIHRK